MPFLPPRQQRQSNEGKLKGIFPGFLRIFKEAWEPCNKIRKDTRHKKASGSSDVRLMV